MKPNAQKWFDDFHLGMQITWGAFAAYERGENVLFAERIPAPEYEERVASWRPSRCEPREWVRLARRAGMEYVMLTARHVDGFCLFDSAVNDFNAVKTGPRRDVVAEFVEACRAEGLRRGVYFSLADMRSAACMAGPEADRAAWDGFVDDTRAQLMELVEGYGPLDLVWIDGGWPYHDLRDTSDYYYGGAWPRRPADWRLDELKAAIRSVQPGAVLQNCFTVNGFPPGGTVIKAGEYGEQWPDCYGGRVRETMISLNGVWGYHRGERRWRSARDVVYNCFYRASSYLRTGNYCLNVGPDGDGAVPAEAERTVLEAGDWFAANREAVEAQTVKAAQCLQPYGELLKRAGERGAYAVFYHWPEGGQARVIVSGLVADKSDPTGARAGDVKSVRLLVGGEPIAHEALSDDVLLLRDLPSEPPDKICTIMVIDY